MLGKVEDRKKPNMRWIELAKEAKAAHVQNLSRAINNRIFGNTLIHSIAVSWKQLQST